MLNLIGWVVSGVIFGVWQYRRRIAAANSTVGMAVPTRSQQALHMLVAGLAGGAIGAAVWGSLWVINSLGH